MKQTTTHPPAMVIFPNDQMDKFKEYMEKTQGMSQRQIAAELMKAKAEVSKEILDRHIKNLDALSQTEGFLSEEHKAKIPMLKHALLSESRSSSKKTKDTDVEGQFFWGFGSSWLWWLILASIWGRGFWGGYGRYPYYY